MSGGLYIIVPAYNESENIEDFIDSWYPIIATHNENRQSRLVIIDDGSKDNTAEIICRASKARPLLVPLSKKNSGHGSTILAGYRYANRHGADYIFQTDSDGQTDPEEFETFWQKRDQYMAVFGNRMDRGDGRDRAIIEKVLCLILRIIFGVKIPDANAPFRLMRREYLEKYLKKMPKHYNLPNVMLTTLGAYYHEKIAFLPITFRPRQGGKNSMNIKRIVKIGIQAVRDFQTIRSRL